MAKTRMWLLTGLFLVNSLAASAEIRTYSAKVVKISDGDTVNVVPEGASSASKPLRIRMISMDTAELHLPTPRGPQVSQGYWGEEGKAELSSIIQVGDRVELEDHGRDTYGRILGRVYKDGYDVNLEMVASGWGALYVICDGGTCDPEVEYRKACRAAEKAKRGIFDAQRPIPELPFVFRSIHQKRPLSKFVGNVRTKRYVEPRNFEDVPICDRVFFTSEAIAAAEGFEPAR